MPRTMRTVTTANLRVALPLSGLVAAAGYSRGALSASGAAGAMLIGSSTYLAGSWRWSALLLSFFLSSSALSRLERQSAGGQAIAALAQRGSRRDLVQTLANGGVGTLAALFQLGLRRPCLAAAYAGSLAAANADTWATEIGGLSRTPPRQILTNTPVPPGTSGGVTALGLLGAGAGAALIGIVAGLVQEPRPSARLGLAVALGGITGALLDSVAGASIQGAFRCPRCDVPTERRTHHCGAATVLTKGWAWCDNDMVNVLCTAGGALVAVLGRSERDGQ